MSRTSSTGHKQHQTTPFMERVPTILDFAARTCLSTVDFSMEAFNGQVYYQRPEFVRRMD